MHQPVIVSKVPGSRFLPLLPGGHIYSTETGNHGTDRSRWPEQMFGSKRSSKLVLTHKVNSSAHRATTLAAIRVASENARLNLSLEIGGIIPRHSREIAVPGRFRWMQQRLCVAFRREEFWIEGVQPGKFSGHIRPLFRGESLRALFPSLGRVEAHPDRLDLRAIAPEADVLFHIALAGKHGSGDGPMNVHAPPTDILENPVVCRRLAPDVMVLRQAVYGDSNI